MNTVTGFARLTLSESSLKKSKNKKNSRYSFSKNKKKSTSDFQSAKYLSKIAAAKSQQQLENIMGSLKAEALKAKNCENSAVIIAGINKVKGKVQTKINNLAIEKAIARKRKEAQLQNKIEESKRKGKILKVRKRARKRQESLDIYEGAKNDAELQKNNQNASYDENNSYDISKYTGNSVGENLDKIASDDKASDTGESTVDASV
ncbi:hypothetical protein [uncultured Clostridium sp.]|uniref:hypothetical protein n=1 Tax=uncultured Clostridium sp. TaxID=59620 RepID=UPI0025EB1D49|nr:hypothetical protein [uncultured Clostridium sp.]